MIALVGLWLPAVVNLAGLRSIAAFQVVTTVLKFVPLLLVVGDRAVLHVAGQLRRVQLLGRLGVDAISAAGAIALFSYLGIETASVAAGRVRDPERNVGRATVLGTLACAVVYLLGTLAVFGTVPHAELLGSTAPFTDSADAIFGGSWAGKTVGVGAVISGFGALVGWTLIVAEMPQAAARDGVFPSVFLRESRRGVPAFGIVASTVLASVLTVAAYTSFDQVFTTVVLLSVLTSVIPYLFSAAAQVYWLATSAHVQPSAAPGQGPDGGAAGPGVLVLVAAGQRAAGRLLRRLRGAARRTRLRVAQEPQGRVRRGRHAAAPRGGGPMTTTAQATRLEVGIHSEVGRLREVIVHRPGLELDRLTPANASALLFDDVMWAERAREEHDAFSAILSERGVRVHHFATLLAEALATEEGRAFAVDRVCTDERFGPALAARPPGPVRRHRPRRAGRAVHRRHRGLGPAAAWAGPGSSWSTQGVDDFVLPPVPNTLFQRDNTAWIGHGATVNPMAMPARRRESLHTRTVYRHHPLFAEAREAGSSSTTTATTTSTTRPPPSRAATSTSCPTTRSWSAWGSGPRRWGWRCWPAACSPRSSARRVLAVELPKARSAMHLDTMLTMVDVATFVAYPYLSDDHTRMWVLTPGEEPDRPEISERTGLQATLSEVLERDDVRVLRATQDVRAAEREQWNDADNYLAIAPGVVVGYERNTDTNRLLADHGIEVAAAGRQRARTRPRRSPLHELPRPPATPIVRRHHDHRPRTTRRRQPPPARS